MVIVLQCGKVNVKWRHRTVSIHALAGRVIRMYKEGIDFADAMHLVASQRHDAFLTFDKTLIHRSKQLTSCQVGEP